MAAPLARIILDTMCNKMLRSRVRCGKQGCRSTCSRMAATSAYRIAEKAYKRDGKRPNAGLSEEQLKDLLDFDECALPNPFFTAFV